MNRMPSPGGDEGGGAQARVNVLAELPLLEARLDAPSLRPPDVDQTQVCARLLHGDHLHSRCSDTLLPQGFADMLVAHALVDKPVVLTKVLPAITKAAFLKGAGCVSISFVRGK